MLGADSLKALAHTLNQGPRPSYNAIMLHQSLFRSCQLCSSLFSTPSISLRLEIYFSWEHIQGVSLFCQSSWQRCFSPDPRNLRGCWRKNSCALFLPNPNFLSGSKINSGQLCVSIFGCRRKTSLGRRAREGKSHMRKVKDEEEHGGPQILRVSAPPK